MIMNFLQIINGGVTYKKFIEEEQLIEKAQLIQIGLLYCLNYVKLLDLI